MSEDVKKEKKGGKKILLVVFIILLALINGAQFYLQQKTEKEHVAVVAETVDCLVGCVELVHAPRLRHRLVHRRYPRNSEYPHTAFLWSQVP